MNGTAVQKLLDFDVAIESLSDGYQARVIASPAGEAHADFTLPFTDQDLEILILKVVGSIGRARRQARRIQSQEKRLLETFGDHLFQAVFSGPVRECLGRSRMAADNQDAGLRIRLRLPPALANVPWEYLYDRENGGFVGLSPETPMVRYVEMSSPVRSFPISPPLRILAMISAPSDVPRLEGEEEWGKLNDALNDLARKGMVQVDRPDAGTLSALQRPLRLHEYHVLHFVGHGGWDEDAQDGALALEGPDGGTRLVTGRDLGLMIRSHRSLRLVVLNACEGARSARDDPFGGVAQALVRQGIPAVIAMQFEISDPAAVVFSKSFYQAIGDGFPVDVAMVEARIAMFAEGNEVEWATPVLYMRSPDGRVFTRGLDPESERKARAEATAGQHLQEVVDTDTSRVARTAGVLLDTGTTAEQPAASVPYSTAPTPPSPSAAVPPSHPVRTLTGHTAAVWGVAFSPDGRLLATGSDEGTARVWDTATGEHLRTLAGHAGGVRGVAFSPDGRLLATASRDGTARLWDPAAGKHLRTLTGHAGTLWGVAFSPDGRLLATASVDGTARLWGPAAGKHLRTLTGHTDRVWGLAFSPDGALLATASADQTARLWDPAAGKHLRTLTGHAGRVQGIAFSPDGALLATTSADQTARLWDPATGKHLRTLTGHTDRVWRVAFSPDGALLATTSADQTARLWDPAAGKHLRTLTGHAGGVWGVAFSPDGHLLATTSDDQTARLWN